MSYEQANFSPFTELSYEDNIMLFSALSDWEEPNTVPMTLPQNHESVPITKVYSSREEHVDEDEIAVLEQRLNELESENWMLKMEHDRLLQEGRHDSGKPAPLLRSFSNELRDTDREIDSIMVELNELSINQSPEESYEPVLETFHQYVYKRQNIIMKEAQQFASPKMQEGLVRLDGVTNPSVENDFAKWVASLSKRGVSEEQKISIRDLLTYHYSHLTEIHEERKIIKTNIKMCYHAKQSHEYINLGEHQGIPVITALANQIELLKKSIQVETELFNDTLDSVSSILTPYQEAEVMTKHYAFYKDKLSTYQLLNNIWKSINSG